MKPIDIPVVGIGPGSQPDDGDQFEFMNMPRGMFRHDLISLPEPEDIADLPAARRLLLDLKAAIGHYRCGDPAIRLDMNGLGARERDLLAQILGEGEVSITVEQDGHRIQIQESVLTGVWWIKYYNSQDALILNTIEIVDIPSVALAAPEDIEAPAERVNEIAELYA